MPRVNYEHRLYQMNSHLVQNVNITPIFTYSSAYMRLHPFAGTRNYSVIPWLQYTIPHSELQQTH